MAIEGLPESGRTRIYRRIVDQLKTDPVLGPAGIRWNCWDGNAEDMEQASNVAVDGPTVELFPTLGPGEFFSADSQRNDLEIEVRALVPSNFDATDCLDLWTAIEQAFYPFAQWDKTLQFVLDLAGPDGLGAETGYILFNRPATIQRVPADDGDGFAAGFVMTGTLTISVLRNFNP